MSSRKGSVSACTHGERIHYEVRKRGREMGEAAINRWLDGSLACADIRMKKSRKMHLFPFNIPLFEFYFFPVFHHSDHRFPLEMDSSPSGYCRIPFAKSKIQFGGSLFSLSLDFFLFLFRSIGFACASSENEIPSRKGSSVSWENGERRGTMKG